MSVLCHITQHLMVHIERVVKGGGSGHDVQSKTKSYSAGECLWQ